MIDPGFDPLEELIENARQIHRLIDAHNHNVEQIEQLRRNNLEVSRGINELSKKIDRVIVRVTRLENEIK